jgi:hypothetical protein
MLPLPHSIAAVSLDNATTRRPRFSPVGLVGVVGDLPMETVAATPGDFFKTVSILGPLTSPTTST